MESETSPIQPKPEEKQKSGVKVEETTTDEKVQETTQVRRKPTSRGGSAKIRIVRRYS